MTWGALLTLGRAVPVDVLACLPTTALALWAVHGMQRHRRIPFRMTLAGFGWGALVAVGIGWAQNTTSMSYLSPMVRYLEAVPLLVTSATPAVFEELAKGAGVVVLYMLVRRRWFDGVVSGIVLGGAVGLGFNFLESIQYMAGNPEFHHWARQALGIMASHTAFTALTGAGIGIAHQASSARAKRIAVLSGLGTAVCGHAANNYLFGRLGWWFELSDNPWIANLVLFPAAMLLMQGPLVLLNVVLLRRGLCDQYAALQVEVPAEAMSGAGAITPDETTALLDPRQRFRAHIQALRRGWASYGQASRLHAAQLDLVMLSWHQKRGEESLDSPAETAARQRIAGLKATVPATVAQQVPA